MTCSGISWAARAFLSHKDTGNSDYKAQRNKTLGFTQCGMAHGRKTASHTAHMQQHPPFCLHLPWPSVSLPTPSPQHTFLLPTFPFPSNIFPLPFSPSSLLLFRQLAACSYLLAMSPVNPKDSLFLLSKGTSFHRNKRQLLFIFVSYNRQKGLASLWELAAHFLTLLPTWKSGSQHTAGDTRHPAVIQVRVLHKMIWTSKGPSRSLSDIQVYTLRLHPTALP